MDIYTEVDEIMKDMPMLVENMKAISDRKILMYEGLKTYYGKLIAHIPNPKAYEYMVQKIANYLQI